MHFLAAIQPCPCGGTTYTFETETPHETLQSWAIRVVARCLGCGRTNPLAISGRPTGTGEWTVTLSDDHNDDLWSEDQL